MWVPLHCLQLSWPRGLWQEGCLQRCKDVHSNAVMLAAVQGCLQRYYDARSDALPARGASPWFSITILSTFPQQ